MSAEKEVIVRAVDAMLMGIRDVLQGAGVEVKEGQPFDLAEHGICDQQGKVRHSDSQRVLEDPQAMQAYKERSAKALWNFAITLKTILTADGLINMAKLGSSKTDFLKDNIGYLDSQHLDENAQERPDRTASNALLIVDPNTLALAQVYRQFLMFIVDNKKSILNLLHWSVRVLVGSILEGALGAADVIKQTLTHREREFEKSFMTHLQPIYETLNKVQPFFIVLESMEQEIEKIISDSSNTPEKKLELIQKLQKDVLDSNIDKEGIESAIRQLEEAKKALSSKTPKELGIDPNSLMVKFDADIQLLRDYLVKYDETALKRQSILQKLEEEEKKIQAIQQEGKRSTPMEKRPSALKARLTELNALGKQFWEAQERLEKINTEISTVKSSLPLRKFLDEAAKISFPYSEKNFNAVVKELGLSKEKIKELSIVCDLVVIRDDSKLKRQMAWKELIQLAQNKVGSGEVKDQSTIDRLSAEAQRFSIEASKIQKNEQEMVDLSRQLAATLQEDTKDYEKKVEPLVITLEATLYSLEKTLAEKDLKLSQGLLEQAVQHLSKIQTLNEDYADCDLDLSAPELHDKINKLKSSVETAQVKVKNLGEDISKLNDRKKLLSDYFSNNGKAIQYLQNRGEQYRLYDKFQKQFSFFRKPNTKADADARRDFLVKISKQIMRYVNSGDETHLKEALSDINDALKTNKFPSRRSGNGSGESMNDLLNTMKSDLESKLTPTEGLEPKNLPK